eukprot:1176119-Prorocentrum_minimum.AAC.1
MLPASDWSTVGICARPEPSRANQTGTPPERRGGVLALLIIWYRDRTCPAGERERQQDPAHGGQKGREIGGGNALCGLQHEHSGDQDRADQCRLRGRGVETERRKRKQGQVRGALLREDAQIGIGLGWFSYLIASR